MSSNRLQRDIASLYKSAPADTIVAEEISPDNTTDLRSVTYLQLGPASTAYDGGAWKVRLRVPPEYPGAPPKAHFLTKIFHPNVHPGTGEVCVDTLKRDWNSDLDLKQIVLTIRCLLIQPNPESALNEEAGKLMLEDYAQFERRARVMTKVHAIPAKEVKAKYAVSDELLPEQNEDDAATSRDGELDMKRKNMEVEGGEEKENNENRNGSKREVTVEGVNGSNSPAKKKTKKLGSSTTTTTTKKKTGLKRL